MPSEWRVWEDYGGRGNVKYRVYRLRDADAPDLRENREYLGDHHNDGGFVFNCYHQAMQTVHLRNDVLGDRPRQTVY
ncbi:hypothetical protein [Selenomonas artemidis]|uniref:hypothetical protein n=1 Tax=Selenomonas artemidis TaxID=671224 RepID=UPI0028F0B076|nr:hypothetical protein [Selenomonas artemidis]